MIQDYTSSVYPPSPGRGGAWPWHPSFPCNSSLQKQTSPRQPSQPRLHVFLYKATVTQLKRQLEGNLPHSVLLRKCNFESSSHFQSVLTCAWQNSHITSRKHDGCWYAPPRTLRLQMAQQQSYVLLAVLHHHTTILPTTPHHSPHHQTTTPSQGKNHHVGIPYGTWGSAQPSLCAFSTTHHGFCCGPAWANLLTFSRGVENKSLFTPDQAQMTHQGPAQQTHELPCGKTL